MTISTDIIQTGGLVSVRRFENYRGVPVMHHCSLAESADDFFKCPYNPNFIVTVDNSHKWDSHRESGCWAILMDPEPSTNQLPQIGVRYESRV